MDWIKYFIIDSSDKHEEYEFCMSTRINDVEQGIVYCYSYDRASEHIIDDSSHLHYKQYDKYDLFYIYIRDPAMYYNYDYRFCRNKLQQITKYTNTNEGNPEHLYKIEITDVPDIYDISYIKKGIYQYKKNVNTATKNVIYEYLKKN